MCVSLRRILTGCRSVDAFLKGGFSDESITLIYGEAETGKTTLTMQCAVNCAMQGFKTLFVDSDRTFTPQRLSQIISKQYEKVPELIVLARPSSYQEQAALVDQLTDYVNTHFKLVVFDTITSLYRLRIAESPSKTFEFNRELNRQLAVLAQTARTKKITILLVSQVHSIMNEMPVSIEPVATRVLKFWADTVISLSLTEDPQRIRATIEKNPAKLPPMTCDLRIGGTGIRD
jgi:DNA repair protein RadB